MSTTTFPTRTDAASTATAGKDYLIYANKGVSDQEPDWLLIGGQRSGKLNRKADELDASHKTSGGWTCHLPGLRSWGIDLESVSKLQWLPGLSFGEAGIRDLTPFTRMQALTELCLPGCDVSDLSPLAGLENLRLVNVTDNRIRDFSPIQRDGIEIIGQDEQR